MTKSIETRMSDLKEAILSFDFGHPLVGRTVVYRDPYKPEPEGGVITSVCIKLNTVAVRYGRQHASQSTTADDRLTFLDGSPVILEV